MKFVDAHLHLSDPEYRTCIEKVIEDAEKANVTALVANSMDLQTSLRSIRLAERYPELVYASVGIHPWNVKELLPKELDSTVKLILDHKEHERLVAIGEIGLDHKYVKGEKEELMSKQYEVFCNLLQLSEKLSMPAIIHSRGTTSEILDVLSSYKIRKVLLHWFTGSVKLLPQIVDHGYYITEGPPAAYSKQIQDILRQIPLTNLLTETDGPVRFHKHPFKGEQTTPAFIPIVVDAIAKVKGKDNAEVAEQIFQNFTTFFKTQRTWPNSS